MGALNSSSNSLQELWLECMSLGLQASSKKTVLFVASATSNELLID